MVKIQTILPQIDQIYKDHAEQHHFPGYAFGIVWEGKLFYAGGGGFSDVDSQIPVTSQSMFRIASMTKSFTAMAILKLRDEKKLKLDDPVYLYVPEIKDQKMTTDAPDITIRDLLTHSAGFPTDDPWADRKLNEDDQDLIAFLKKGIFFSNVPGIAYEYSNLGYTLLGYIIKKITGKSYDRFILETICQPIGMEKISWEFTNVPSSQLVHGYNWNNGKWEEQELLKNGIFGAMGGMITSIEAFSHYMAFHLSAWPPRNDIEVAPIKRSSIREMHQPWRFKKMGEAYGYGLSWSRDTEGRTFIGHDGGLPGFGCNWLIMPEYDLGVVLLANLTYAPAREANLAVLDKIIKEAQLKPRELQPSDLLTARKNALVKFLPDWIQAEESGLFADNFFLDHPIDAWRSEARKLFEKMGKVISVSDVIPVSRSRGSFTIQGEKSILQVKFSLTPENPPLIQECHIKEMDSFQ